MGESAGREVCAGELFDQLKGANARVEKLEAENADRIVRLEEGSRIARAYIEELEAGVPSAQTRAAWKGASMRRPAGKETKCHI